MPYINIPLSLNTRDSGIRQPDPIKENGHETKHLTPYPA